MTFADAGHEPGLTQADRVHPMCHIVSDSGEACGEWSDIKSHVLVKVRVHALLSSEMLAGHWNRHSGATLPAKGSH
jgi:hypothetical protein